MPSGPEAFSIPPVRTWCIAGLLFLAGFINYIDRAIVSVALPVIGVELSLGPAAKGVLLSAFFWSYALMQLPVGWVVDRYNLRMLYAGAFLLWSVSCGLTGLATTIGVLMLMRVVMGVGESIYMPGGMKIISLLFRTSERGLPAGLMNCGTRAGLAIGGPLIAYLVQSLGWHRSFYVLGFGALFWLIPWFSVYPANLRSRHSISPPSLRSTVATFDRNLLGMCLGHVGYSYYWYLFVTWLPDYLVESRHMTLQRAGAFVFIPYMVFTISEPLGGWIADRLIAYGIRELHARRLVVTVAFLSSIMLLVAAHQAGDTAAVLMIGAASFVGLATGNLYVLTANLAPEGALGVWMGILNFSGNLSGVVAPLVTGLVIQHTNSYYPSFVVAVSILLLALPVYWWVLVDNIGPSGKGTCCPRLNKN
jgi:MFS family permease